MSILTARPGPGAPLFYQQEVTMVHMSNDAISVDRSRRLSARFTVTTGPGDVMCLHGELDLATAPQLEGALRARSGSGDRALVIDLSDLSFSGCAGLAVLLAEHHRRRAAHSDLLLIAPTAGLRRILTLTGLDAVLNIRPAGVLAA